jgi:hypothetical protein
MKQGHVFRAGLRQPQRTGVVGNEYGVCLTELLLSLAIGATVLAATYSTFNIIQGHTDRQHKTIRHQQDVRLGLEVFEQEARLATTDFIITAAPNEFKFLANINDQRTVTTGSVAPGQLTLSVQNGSGWGEGKTVVVCGPQDVCEMHRLMRVGQRYQLTLAEPVGRSFPAGASVEVRNHVTYYTKPNEAGAWKLMRMVDGGANVLMGDLEEPHFSYRDEDGRITGHPSSVKRVVLEVESDNTQHRIRREISLRS